MKEAAAMKNETGIATVGLVGLGFIAEYHCRGARLAAPDAHIIGLDLDEEAARRFLESRVDRCARLVRSTNSSTHGPMSYMSSHLRISTDPLPLQLLEAGIDVLLEKPLSHSVEECAAIRDAAARSGALVGVSHNQLFYKKWEAARRVLAEGEIGKICAVDVVARNALGFLPRRRRASMDDASECQRAVRSCPTRLRPGTGCAVRHRRVLSANREVPRYWATVSSSSRSGTSWQLPETSRFGFSLAYDEGFGESTIAVRGSLGELTMDFNRNTSATQMRTFAPFDLEGFEQSMSSARSLAGGAMSTLAQVVAGKAGVEQLGDPYSVSIARSIEVFYENRERRVVDERHSITFATEVVELAEQVATKSGVDRDPPTMESRKTHRESVSRSPRVVVIGGTGFIGSHLVRALSESQPVRVLARNPTSAIAKFADSDVDVVGADARDTDEVMRHIEPGMIVYHLAFGGGTTWDDLRASDVDPTIALAEACEKRGIGRFVYASSIAGYDASGAGTTITEATPFSPGVLRVAPYARAKAVVEDHLNAMFEDRGFPIVICRPGIVLGVQSDPVHWGVAAWRHPNVCVHWGSGNNPLPIVLVEDVADAMARMSTAPGILGETFNLAAPSSITAEEYLAEVSRASGSPIRRRPSSVSGQYASALAKWMLKLPGSSRVPFPSAADIAGRSFAARFDCSKAEQLLGWTPECDRMELLRRGVTEPAVAWAR